MKRGNIIVYKIVASLLATVALVCCLVWFVRQTLRSEVHVDASEAINVTPEQIVSIKSVGEWEFLAVADEELVDTVRKGLLSDDHLVRIYYGTLRLGINMHHVKPGWMATSGDSITVTLPPIELLDRDFIDEARTKSFYETGKWSQKDREALYRKAYRMMLNRGMTQENLLLARQNGEAQFRRMMLAMGYRQVVVRWQR